MKASHALPSALLSLALSLCTLACMPPLPAEEGNAGEGGIEILDAGLLPTADAGAGNETSADAGTPGSDAGPGPQPGADAGFTLPDGGLSLPDGGSFDTYQGEAEEGVRCGDPLETCAAGEACCLSLNFQTFSLVGACGAVSDGQCTGGDFTGNEFVVGCDGREDCATGEVCCITGLSAFSPRATCTEAATCDDPASGGDRACTDTSECSAGLTCCGISGFSLPADVGVCQAQCGF